MPVEYVQPLADATIVEGETVSFTCVVSKANRPAKWFKDGKELSPSEHIEPILDDVKHTLTVHDALLEDGGKYSIAVEEVESTATLTVKGLTPLYFLSEYVIFIDIF